MLAAPVLKQAQEPPEERLGWVLAEMLGRQACLDRSVDFLRLDFHASGASFGLFVASTGGRFKAVFVLGS